MVLHVTRKVPPAHGSQNQSDEAEGVWPVSLEPESDLSASLILSALAERDPPGSNLEDNKKKNEMPTSNCHFQLRSTNALSHFHQLTTNRG